MSGQADQSRLVVGVMTGTSIDGMDLALAEVVGSGLEIQVRLLRHGSYPLDDLAAELRVAAEQKPMTAGQFASLAWRFGELHARVIAEFVADAHGGPDLIVVHGQTVFHQPPISWQLVNPAPIAARFDCPVISDLRQADLAAGGQGAPITPLADWILFRDAGSSRAIINLGGFCNVTILPRCIPPPSEGGGKGVGEERDGGITLGPCTDPRLQESAYSLAGDFHPHPGPPPRGGGGESAAAIRGFDVCACNQVLDAVAREALGRPFDSDGRAARSGKPQTEAVRSLRAILSGQRSGQRSLGTGDEAARWVDDHRARIAPDDLAASAVAAIAECIATAIEIAGCDEIIVAGGGARNQALLDALRQRCHGKLRLSDELGVPLESREALAMAVLGVLSMDGVPITLPQVTSCREPAPVAGLVTNHRPMKHAANPASA